MDKQSFRDMCAAMAMQGMVAGRNGDARNAEVIANQAFDVADAMAAERERRDIKRDSYGRVVG